MSGERKLVAKSKQKGSSIRLGKIMIDALREHSVEVMPDMTLREVYERMDRAGVHTVRVKLDPTPRGEP